VQGYGFKPLIGRLRIGPLPFGRLRIGPLPFGRLRIGPLPFGRLRIGPLPFDPSGRRFLAFVLVIREV
jgi:hypothetical protein